MRAVVKGLKAIGKALKDSHDSYVLEALVANAISEDQTTRVLARIKLRKQFPHAYRELRRVEKEVNLCPNKSK